MSTGKTYSTKYLLDSNNNRGAEGQVLSTTSTGIDWVDANTVPGTGLWLANGNDIYNSNSANVGIGTTNPGTKLHIDSVSTYPTLTLARSTTHSGISFTAGITNFTGAGADLLFDGVGNDTGFGFRTRNSSGTLLNTLILAPSGNVGIGTTSPDAKLSIKRASNAINTEISFIDGGGTRAAVIGMEGATTNDMLLSTLGGIRFYTASNVAVGSVPSNERMRIDSSGNVGIGDPNPTNPLTVSKTASGSTTQIASLVNPVGTANTGVRLWMSGTNTTTRGTFIDAVAETTSNDHSLRFGTSAASSTPAERMRIDSNGKVSVGTPVVGQLGVRGTTDDSTAYSFESANLSGNTLFAVRNDGLSFFSGNVGIGTTSIGTESNLYLGASSSNEGGQITLQKATGGTLAAHIDAHTSGGKDFMRILSGGNTSSTAAPFVFDLTNVRVGIGTTSPNTKLQVSGTGLQGMQAWFGNGFVNNANYHYSFAKVGFSSEDNDGADTGAGFQFNTRNAADTNWMHGYIYQPQNGGIAFGTGGAGTTQATERMRIDSAGAIKFNAYNGTNQTGSPTHILGTDANGLIVKSTAGSSIGPWLPLAAGSGDPLTGALYGTGANFSSNVTINGTIIGTDQTFGGAYRTFAFGNNANGYNRVFAANDTSDGIYINASTGHGVRFRVNGGGTNVVQISSSGDTTFTGNVGIGTTAVTSPGFWYDATNKYLAISHWSTPPTPAALLHLSDNSNDIDVPQIRIEGRENPGDTRLDIAVKDADVRFNLVENNTDASNGYGKMHFKTNANANSSHPTRGGFLFQTGAGSVIDALTITNEGNVGIGTTSPADKLEVNGNLSIFGNKIYNGSASNSAGVSFPGSTTRIDGYNGITFHSSTTTVGSQSERMRITNAGNVGIGTTSPTTKLHIEGPSGSVYVKSTTENQNSSIYFNSLKGGVQALRWEVGTNISAGSDLEFFDRLNSASRMVIQNDGNVGIGTTSPDAKLEIKTDGNVDNFIKLNSTKGTGNIYGFKTNGVNSDVLAIMDITAGNRLAAIGQSEISFATGGTTRLLMNSSGNVGIGTTSPGAKLDVAGAINTSGSINLTNAGVNTIAASNPSNGYLRFLVDQQGVALTLNADKTSTFGGEIYTVDGNKAAPGYSFTSDPDTGMFRDSANVLVLGVNGDTRIRMSNTNVVTYKPLGVNTTSITSGITLEVAGNTLLKNSNGVGDLYLGNYATANHFRFHTNNANTYFDMNCGDIYWRQGTSTRYQFFASTANMTIQGTLTQNSDARTKENIVEISDCISKVKAMRGVYYNRTDFNTDVTKVGVIAQEVEAVLPELVLESPETGLKSVAYSELTSVLINAIKEQQEIIEDLKSRITKLEN